MSRFTIAILLLALTFAPAIPDVATAASAESIDREVDAALQKLYATNPQARMLRDNAYGILVFPNMLKAGFMFGGQIGEGALRLQNRTVGYYNSVAASYGFQAGVQTFGYALFLMNKDAVDSLDSAAGFELGLGPSVVVLDEGIAKTMTTKTLDSDVYAIVFDQSGLMAGLGIQGSKITRVNK